MPNQKIIIIKAGTKCRLKDNVVSDELSKQCFEVSVDCFDFQKHIYVKSITAGENMHTFYELPLNRLVFFEIEKNISCMEIFSTSFYDTQLGKLERERLIGLLT